MHNLQCSHLEADTAMLFIYSRIRVLGDTSAVLIDAEDADVVVLAAYASSIIDGQLTVKRKKVIIDSKTLCSREMAKIVVPLHVATGCDAVVPLHVATGCDVVVPLHVATGCDAVSRSM